MALFTPPKVGDLNLSHRIVLAPLTRYKADLAHVPFPVVKEYYALRASTPGTLLITEGTFIAPQAGGYDNISGIWSPAQIAGWKEIVDGVHAAGSSIFMQLWALGRSAEVDVMQRDGYRYVSASAIPLEGLEGVPEPMTVEEIAEFVGLFAQAAKNAVEGAGFDGVEIHSANGYLLDQFLQDVTNTRTDAYGGSVEHRARFTLEVLDAVVKAVGPKKAAIRFSPWSNFQDMGMADPMPQFIYTITQIKERHPDLAYLHMVEPRVNGNADRESLANEGNDAFRKIWAPRAFVTAGGFNKKEATDLVQKTENGLVAFGRLFISNPDLVRRLKYDIPITPTDRSKYYIIGDDSGLGYVDWPIAA